MIEWKQITMQEAENKMEVLREIFDIVRLLKGSDLQAAARVRPDFGFDVVRKRRADGKFLPGVYRSVQRQAFDRAAGGAAL